MKPFITTILLIFSLSVFAQEFSLQGKVVDKDGNPMSYVNILIAKSVAEPYEVSSGFLQPKGTATNDDGSFVFENLETGTYKIVTSFIGFKAESKIIEITKDKTIEAFVLQEDSEALDQITITAKRPTITRKPDRLTFNIENTALTEGNTLQVLRSTPGVIVSEGSINIKSAAATIFINNRRVQLTSGELIQLLESAPANSIKAIDVITNPPASYDADSGSVINIIMSKNLITGYRGSVNTSYTQGVFPRFNAGTNHYFKTDKINLNLNYNYTGQLIDRVEDNGIDYLDSTGNIDQIWNSDIDRNTKSEIHNLNLNFDYFISKKTTLSLTSTGIFTPYFKYQINNNTIITDANANFIDQFRANNLSRDDKYNIGTDLSLRTTFNSGSSLSLNGHYTTYNYNRDQRVNQDYQIDDTQDSQFRTLADQDTKIYTAKADYSLPINDSSSFDAGAKFSNINTESSLNRFDINNGVETLNSANSNAFDYDEKVFAAYANYSKSWDKWDIVFGLRTEQTNINGFSSTLNQTNTQDYFEWFPNASISRTFSDNFNLYGNYKRSITRPSYTNLNPFTFFLNENTTVEGNPALQPTFRDHFVLGSSFLEHFTVEAYYINYNGAINEIPRQDNVNNILAYTPVNLDKTVDFGFDFALDINPTKRWNLYFVTSFYNISEENGFGTEKIELDQWSNYSILANNISFLEDKSLNVSFNLTFVGKNLQGFQIVDDRLVSDLSITKSVFNKKGVLSLAIEDLFNDQDYRTNVRYLNQSSRQFTNVDNRFVRLGFRYKFGNTKLNTNQRTTSAEERDRINDLN